MVWGLLCALNCVIGVTASTITVTDGGDSGIDTLRQAILDAVDGDIIDFSVTTVTLGSQISVIQDGVTVDGGGVVTITTDGLSRAFYIHTHSGWSFKGLTFDGCVSNVGEADGGVFYIRYAPGTSFENCVFTNNSSTIWGGAVYFKNDASSSFNNCVFTGNSAAKGGAIGGEYGADMSLTNCSFYGNSADYGGGVSATAGTFVDCNFYNNSATSEGGGFWIEPTSTSTGLLVNCTITNNESAGVGGGVYVYNKDGDVIVIDSLIAENLAGGSGGGLYTKDGGSNETSLTIKNTTIRNNKTTVIRSGSEYEGGGAINSGSAMIVENCSILDNEAPFANGGGICSVGLTTTFKNCTISGNIAGAESSTARAGNGGGLYAKYATVEFYNSTVANNIATNMTYVERTGSGGGIYFYYDSGTSVRLYSTIVADNSARWVQPDIGSNNSSIISTNSLIETSVGYTISSGSGNIQDTDPMLGALGNNGGDTLTIAISKNSPARNTGYNPLSLAYDQRGLGFPRDDGNGVDIGAFEWSPSNEGTLFIVQ
jgi:hypothetical protein